MTVAHELLLARLHVIGAEPEFDRTMVPVTGVPGFDVKEIDDEDTPIPESVALPDRFTVMTGLSDALLYIVTEPENAPADTGEKVTARVSIPDAATVSGARMVVVKSDDDICTAFITVAAVPALRSAIFIVLELPAVIFPKSIDTGAALSCGVAAVSSRRLTLSM